MTRSGNNLSWSENWQVDSEHQSSRQVDSERQSSTDFFEVPITQIGGFPEFGYLEAQTFPSRP